MTNYEWLVKNGKLEQFIYDIRREFYQSCEIGPRIIDANRPFQEERINLEKRYGISFINGKFKPTVIAEWLQRERNSEKYIKAKDVFRAFDEAMMDTKDGKIFNEAAFLTSVGKLECFGKEINDDT